MTTITEPILEGPDHIGSHAAAFPFIRDFEAQQVKLFWNANHVEVDKDRKSFLGLPKEQRDLVKNLLGFFVVGDDIVGRHLDASISPHISRFELVNFTACQKYVERVHMQAYDRIIDAMLPTPGEVEEARDAVRRLPAVAALTKWIEPFLPDTPSSMADRITAFVCFEGIVFSAAFAIIHWLKTQNACPGLCQANEWIARDEGIHTRLWAAVFSLLKNKPNREHTLSIIKSAVQATEQFARDVIPKPIGIISAENMSSYIRVVTARVCELMGLGKTEFSSAKNPFQFTVNINLHNNTDLFVTNVSEYSGVGSGSERVSSTDLQNEDF